MKKIVLGILVFLVAAYIIFDKIGDAGLSKEFTQKQDSLVAAVDSMKTEILAKDAEIDSLEFVDETLTYQVEHQKAKVIRIDHWIDSSKAKIDTYTEHELVSSFNNRYPKDTVTNPLPLAQPVLVSAAKDLVELDGVKQQLKVKDTIINLAESRITTKDSIISKYVSKENTYRNIMVNQYTQIKDWKTQYNQLYLTNQKLKMKGKFTKIGAGIVVGGLVYLMIAK